MIVQVVTLSALLMLTACQQPLRDAPRSGVHEYEKSEYGSDLGNLRIQNKQIVGTGRMLFKDVLSGVNSREHYRLEGRFLGDDSELSLNSHFNGFTVKDGLILKFSRHGDHLHISAIAPGYPEKELKEIDKFFSQAKTWFSFRVEIFDGGPNGIEITIWNEKRILQSARWEILDTFTRKTALFDSKSEGVFFFTHGEGIRWGVELKNTEISTARRLSPVLGGDQ